MSQQKELRLAIQGMHCAASVNRVTTALKKVTGVDVRKVEVGSAELDYDPQAASPEQITAAVNRIGFTAQVAGE
jgi:copper chaperone CopZ